MNDDDLGRMFDEIASPLTSRPGRAAGIVAASRRRRAYAAVAGVTAVVVLVVGSLAFLDGGGHGTRLSPAAPTPTPAVRTSAVAPTTSASPVPTPTAPPGTVSIGCSSKAPFVALSHIKPGVYGTAIAAPLRAFLAKPGPDAALRLDQLPHQQWALFSHDALYRIFVQRTTSGIGAVLTFKLYHGSWRPAPGCQIAYPDGVAQRVDQAALRGRTLDLNWDNGTCYPEAGRPLSELVRRVIVTETTTHVLISLVTYENPAELAAMASQQAVAPSDAVVACAGVGLPDHVKVTLKAPLGTRTLLSVGQGGTGPITLDGTVGAPLQ